MVRQLTTVHKLLPSYPRSCNPNRFYISDCCGISMLFTNKGLGADLTLERRFCASERCGPRNHLVKTPTQNKPPSQTPPKVPDGFFVFVGAFSWLCVPQCHPDHLAVRLTLGAHQGVPIHVYRRRNLCVVHQILLHPDRRSSIVQPRTAGVRKVCHPTKSYFPAASQRSS
jgi:hypothetical protein